MVTGDLEEYDRLALLTDDPQNSWLNLYIKENRENYFRPSSTILPFNPNMISSAYYLSPMFRLFQFFSDSKYNRLNMITPGLWGTIEGGFIGLPRATEFRIDVSLPEDGEYRLLMRGAATANILDMAAGFEFLPERRDPEHGFVVVPLAGTPSVEAGTGRNEPGHGFVVVPASEAETADSRTEPRELRLQSDPSNLSIYDKRTVFTTNRVALDPQAYTYAELERLIPTDAVAINSQYQFFDLGKIEGKAGKYTIYFDKFDNAPMLVEGIVVIPEEDYQEQLWPDNVQIVTEDDLCCGVLVRETEELP